MFASTVPSEAKLAPPDPATLMSALSTFTLKRQRKGHQGGHDVYRDVSLFTGDPQLYTATAIEETEALTLRKIDVEGILQMFPESEEIFKRRTDLLLKQLG